jgi:hypothetical protein
MHVVMPRSLARRMIVQFDSLDTSVPHAPAGPIEKLMTSPGSKISMQLRMAASSRPPDSWLTVGKKYPWACRAMPVTPKPFSSATVMPRHAVPWLA